MVDKAIAVLELRDEPQALENLFASIGNAGSWACSAIACSTILVS